MKPGFAADSPFGSARLFAAALFLVFVAISAFVAYQASLRLQHNLDQSISVFLQKHEATEDQLRILLQRFIVLRDIVTTDDPFEKDDLIQYHSRLASQFMAARIRLSELGLKPDEVKILEQQVERTRQGYVIQNILIDESIEKTDPEHYQRVLEEVHPILDDVYQQMLSYRKLLIDLERESLEKATRDYELGWQLILAYFVVALLFGSLAVVWISARQRQYSRSLEWQARHDSLTGLANRHLVTGLLQGILDKGQQKGSLLYMDLDRFKLVNDSCGHLAGDEFLVQLADKLKIHLAGRGEIARIGGDEFVVLLEDADRQRVERVARQIQTTVGDFCFVWEGREYRVGVSIGMVSFSDGFNVVADIFRAADTACYAAKDAGRNRIHWYSSDDLELKRRETEVELIKVIRAALENNRLRLFRQIIQPLGEHASKHYEILLRIEDEEGRLLKPADYLGAAERYRLISQIDCWVFENTLLYMKEEGYTDCLYNINLSADTLNDDKCLKLFVRLLKESGVSGARVCLEITETAAIVNLGKALRFIETMRELGCKFALDDFGTGLCSFKYLRQLPVEYLKIDGSYIRKMDRDPRDVGFVVAINKLSHQLGIQTVAEWVEDEKTMCRLKDLGVDFAQGFHIGRPEPLKAG